MSDYDDGNDAICKLSDSIEDVRLSLRKSQHMVAEELGISQPHYSKIVRSIVRPSDDLRKGMETWLDRERSNGIASDDPRSPMIRQADAGMLREAKSLLRAINLQTSRLVALMTNDRFNAGIRLRRAKRAPDASLSRRPRSG